MCPIPLPDQTTQTAICSDFTGATGLEPATSSVTGRLGRDDAPRQTSLNRVICRCFSLCSDVLSAWLSQSSNRRLGHEWATETCLHGQRHADARDITGAACCAGRPAWLHKRSMPVHRNSSWGQRFRRAGVRDSALNPSSGERGSSFVGPQRCLRLSR
jgi:hypothetical protein